MYTVFLTLENNLWQVLNLLMLFLWHRHCKKRGKNKQKLVVSCCLKDTALCLYQHNAYYHEQDFV